MKNQTNKLTKKITAKELYNKIVERQIQKGKGLDDETKVAIGFFFYHSNKKKEADELG